MQKTGVLIILKNSMIRKEINQFTLFIYFFSAVLVLELRVYTLSHFTKPFCFCEWVFQTGFHLLFARAGFA
jgi:hypothetical protein